MSGRGVKEGMRILGLGLRCMGSLCVIVGEMVQSLLSWNSLILLDFFNNYPTTNYLDGIHFEVK